MIVLLSSFMGYRLLPNTFALQLSLFVISLIDALQYSNVTDSD